MEDTGENVEENTAGGMDTSVLQKENQNLIDEKLKLQEQIHLLQEQLRQAGIKPITSAPSSPSESPKVQCSDESLHIKKKPARKARSLDNQSTNQTYGKRRGTADHGKEYEYLMCAYYALKFITTNQVVDFQMRTNDETYGDFDDIVLTAMLEDGTSHTFLLQLKHTENKKNITERILTVEKGDFSLLKYFKSFQNLKNKDNISCILFTNRTANIRNDSEILLDCQEIGVKSCKSLLLDNLLNTNHTKSYFQFEVIEGCEMSAELEKFFRKFYLLSDQSNVAKIKSSVNEMLRQLLQVEIYDNFTHYMKYWWSENFILTKDIIIAKLVELALSPFVKAISDEKCTEKSKLLEETIMKFDLTIVQGQDEEIVNNIWKEDYNDDLKKAMISYGLTTKKLENIDHLSLLQKSKVLWYVNKAPLIVKVDDLKKDAIVTAVKLLQLSESKKKIVLLGAVSRDEFPGWNIFENLSDLSNEDVYLDISKNFKIAFQGRECISLEKLVTTDNDVAKIIGAKELIFMSQDTLQVGVRKEELPTAYIPRLVTTTFLDTEKVLNNCDHSNDLLIINCDKKFKNVIQVKDLKVLELYDYLAEIDSRTYTRTRSNIIVLSTKNKCTKAQFDSICQKSCKRNIFLIQVIDTKCCILVLSKENPFQLREMEYKRAPVEEHQIHSFFDNPVNVVCAQPGMGKSTLTTYLRNSCPSNFWSIRVNLKEHNSFLRKKPKNEEILARFIKLKPSASFLQKMKGVFLKNKKIYLFLDGLDEIGSGCVDYILDYVKYISSHGVHVWICSRKNLEETIVNHLNIFPIDIKELNQWQQKTYIYNRLQSKFEPDEINQLANDIFNNVEAINSDSLLGIPLKLFIITENFLDNKELYTQPDQDQVFVLTTMYRLFFEGKKKHQYRKVGLQDEQQLGFNFNLYLEQYEIPALKSCLDQETFAKLDLDMTKSLEFLESVKQGGDKFGIISQVHEDDKAVFTHQTYAEYFACVWLKKNLDKVRLLEDNFFKKEHENLRFMFDIMLAEKCPLHLAVIYRNLDQVIKHIDCEFVKDEGGRNPLHLISSLGNKQRPLKSNYEYNLEMDNQKNRESVVFKEIIKLVSKFNPFEVDQVFNWTALDYATAAQCLYPIESALESYKSSISLGNFYKTYSKTSLAFYSSHLGYQNLLTTLLTENPALAKVKVGFEGTNLLHVAVKGLLPEEENVGPVEILIENGADVNAGDETGRTPLHWAAEQGHYQVIKTLLDRGANIDSVTNHGETILHYATRKWKQSNVEAVNLLVNSGVNVNAKDRLGVTALHLASEKEYYEMVKDLLDKGANVNAINRQGESVLHYAVRAREPNTKVKLLRSSIYDIINNEELFASEWTSKQKQYGMVKMLLEKGAAVDVVTKEGETVLHYAAKAWKPNFEVISLLIDSGVDVNAKNKQGITALHRALQKGHYDAVKILLEKGADVQAVSNEDETILHYATRTLRPSSEIIELLVDSGVDVNAKDKNGLSVLHWASEEGHYALVKILVEKGADVNASTDSGTSVLHYAAQAWKPNREVMKLLALNGAEVNVKDKNGVSVLHWVSEIGFFDVAKILLDKGADVNVITNKAETVLHYATKARDPSNEVVELLVSAGVDVNAKDNDGITALHWASERGHYDIVKILLENNVDINAITNGKETVLNYALRSREAETGLIKLLVKSGVDVNTKDKDGISALHWVCERAHYDMAELLLKKGADVNAVTNQRETVLHYAAIAREENGDVIKILLKNGIGIDAKDVDGKTALHNAVERGIYENIEHLLDSGANVGAVTRKKLTCLHYAVYRGRVEMVQLLIDRGIDLGKIDIYNDQMPLYFAGKNGHLQAELLLKMTVVIYNNVNLSLQSLVRYLREEFTEEKPASPSSAATASRMNHIYRTVSRLTINRTTSLWNSISCMFCSKNTKKEEEEVVVLGQNPPHSFTCTCHDEMKM